MKSVQDLTVEEILNELHNLVSQHSLGTSRIRGMDLVVELYKNHRKDNTNVPYVDARHRIYR